MKTTAGRLLNASFEELSTLEQRVVRRFTERKHVSRNTNAEFKDQLTSGQRLADRVAAVGGSWTFIVGFVAVLIAWVIVNSFVLAKRGEEFDPFPYILLNLVLSMLASIQAPVIMMSQNRVAAKDRMDAAHDYEVNLKAELEILELHQKVDALRDQQWRELIVLQQEQITLLKQLLENRRDTGREPADNSSCA